MEHVIGSYDEFPPGVPTIITVGGDEIGIFNIEGHLYAIRNRCPHQGAPLCRGTVDGAMLPSQPEELVYGLEGQAIKCPWHRWKFSLQTGESLFHVDRRRVKTFPIRIVDGRVLLETGR